MMDRPTLNNVLILGSTGGIGRALVEAVQAGGATVTGVSRADGLDWERPERAEAALLDAANDGPFDMVFDATGALQIDGYGPEKKLAAIDAAGMARQFAVNAIGPALVMKHHDVLLARKGKSVLATLSARIGSIGDNRLGGWISYRSAKAALNQVVRTAAIEIARKRPEAVVVALHPGTVRTALGADIRGDRDSFSPAESAAKLLAVLDGLDAAASGGFFDYDGQTIPW